MDNLNIKKIRRLVRAVDISTIVQESGVSRRTLYRMRADVLGKLPGWAVLSKLNDWAKGYK